jgi:nucleolar GTP-binding protein
MLDERNNMEKLTLAALSYLPTAIVYVHDLTGECGVTVADQVSS